MYKNNFYFRNYNFSFKIITIIIIILQLYLNKYLVVVPKHEKERIVYEKLINKENLTSHIDFCYYSPNNSCLKILHLIFTRFMIEFSKTDHFIKTLYTEEYIKNGIRVMKKYLIPSLENQSCKKFSWILVLGDKVNITNIKSLIDFNTSFEMDVIYNNDSRNYIKNVSEGYDILISTRIDYDDRIYYDAVNDVRKVINIYKPLILHGYNRGVIYLEVENKYYHFYLSLKEGVWSVFASLVTVLNQVNYTLTINDLGAHTIFRKNILNSYKSFGIKELNYEIAIFDSGEPKFVYVRQKFSRDYRLANLFIKNNKEYNFNLNKFYGK